MIFVDFHVGDKENGCAIRKRLLAKKTCERLELRWENYEQF